MANVTLKSRWKRLLVKNIVELGRRLQSDGFSRACRVRNSTGQHGLGLRIYIQKKTSLRKNDESEPQTIILTAQARIGLRPQSWRRLGTRHHTRGGAQCFGEDMPNPRQTARPSLITWGRARCLVSFAYIVRNLLGVDRSVRMRESKDPGGGHPCQQRDLDGGGESSSNGGHSRVS